MQSHAATIYACATLETLEGEARRGEGVVTCSKRQAGNQRPGSAGAF
jgi:hypothetical protein